MTIGNGNMLVGLDKFGQLYDLYFPYVGLENHVGGHLFHKVGVHADDRFSWLDSGEWHIEVTCPESTMSGVVTARHEGLGLQLLFEDTIYNERDIYVRKIGVTNLRDDKRIVKVYINQQFEIYESHRGDTAYFDPRKNVLIHYKGRRVFVINAMKDNEIGIDDYSIGLFGIEGKEGTYKDAEDGILSKNPIEHGFVDSTVGFTFDIGPNQSQQMYYWISVAKKMEDALENNDYISNREPENLVRTTRDYWKAWTKIKNFNFQGLTPEVVDLFYKSLLVIRAHFDNRGAIIASSDSDMLKSGRDTYSYMWPRDGALTAYALDKAGYFHTTKQFYRFCRNIITEDGYFMHKYRSDESLGSSWHPWVHHGKVELPIQEDETALVIRSLWHYYVQSKNLELVEELYNPLIKKAADFMVAYLDEDGLPRPSYDLWEEHFCVSTFTASSVYAGLVAAAKFAKLLGKTDHQEKYERHADRVRVSIVEKLYDEKEGHFIKMLCRDGENLVPDMTLDMSSIYGIFMFDVLDVNDERVENSISAVHQKLERSDTQTGGIPRYQDDHYYRSPNDQSGNPWIITSLWLAQYYIKKATKEADFDKAIEWLNWTNKYALPSGVLPEQINPFTGEGLSATPLTWSHAEFVSTIVQYLEKLEELGICKMCLPTE